MNDINYQKLAFELENYLIVRKEWDTCGAPEAYIKEAIAGCEEGVPTGFGKHPKYGWFVIWTAGQGPRISLLEKDPRDHGSS
jgi:hypothetical protein